MLVEVNTKLEVNMNYIYKDGMIIGCEVNGVEYLYLTPIVVH